MFRFFKALPVRQGLFAFLRLFPAFSFKSFYFDNFFLRFSTFCQLTFPLHFLIMEAVPQPRDVAGKEGMMTMKTKRIASLLLSAALLLSLAVPAFAENPTTEETAEPETAVQEVEPEALTEDDAVAPVAEPTAKKEYTYVAIGDSVTAGVGLSGLQYKLVQNGFDMSGNYKGYDGQCFVGYVADQLGLDRDHAINLGLPAVMTKDLADLIETGAMPAMNHYSGVQYTSVPELKEYIQKADLITLQIGANDALIRTIVALGEATNWKSEKLANSMVTGMFRNLTPDNIDYFMDCLKQLTLTPSEFRAVMYLLTTGMGQICTSTYADTVTQLERVMKDLRELNPEAQIMILSYNNPVPLMPSWSRHFRRLNTAAAKLAAQYDVTYVPIPYTRTANDGHPTVSGHKYIGRQILKAVNY